MNEETFILELPCASSIEAESIASTLKKRFGEPIREVYRDTTEGDDKCFSCYGGVSTSYYWDNYMVEVDPCTGSVVAQLPKDLIYNSWSEKLITSFRLQRGDSYTKLISSSPVIDGDEVDYHYSFPTQDQKDFIKKHLENNQLNSRELARLADLILENKTIGISYEGYWLVKIPIDDYQLFKLLPSSSGCNGEDVKKDRKLSWLVAFGFSPVCTYIQGRI